MVLPAEWGRTRVRHPGRIDLGVAVGDPAWDRAPRHRFCRLRPDDRTQLQFDCRLIKQSTSLTRSLRGPRARTGTVAPQAGSIRRRVLRWHRIESNQEPMPMPRGLRFGSTGPAESGNRTQLSAAIRVLRARARCSGRTEHVLAPREHSPHIAPPQRLKPSPLPQRSRFRREV